MTKDSIPDWSPLPQLAHVAKLSFDKRIYRSSCPTKIAYSYIIIILSLEKNKMFYHKHMQHS